jgi:hypothetical protein
LYGKRQFFAKFFGENILKNHNIGPWLRKLSIEELRDASPEQRCPSIEISKLEQVPLFALVLHFLEEKQLAKYQLISTQDKVINCKGTIFQRSTKPLFGLQNRVEIS